jgi:hypothetical protein
MLRGLFLRWGQGRYQRRCLGDPPSGSKSAAYEIRKLPHSFLSSNSTYSLSHSPYEILDHYTLPKSRRAESYFRPDRYGDKGESMVEQIAVFIANFDPWWMVATAIVLILLDWMLLQTVAFITLGLGTLILALINALGFSPMVQLWSYPIAIFSSFFIQRKLFELITTVKTPYDSLETMGLKGLQVHVGKTGTLKVISNKDESSDYFYSYKDSLYEGSDIDPKNTTGTNIPDIIKVLMSDGSMHPSKVIGNTEIRDGLIVKVIGVSNGALMVEEKNKLKD